MSYRQAEAQATMLRCWGPLVVPGLLQCESYARATLSVEPYSPEQLAELVAARMERRADVWAGAAHGGHRSRRTAALHRVSGRHGGAVRASSFTMVERPDITLHVVPEGTNVGLWGAFDIAGERWHGDGEPYYHPGRQQHRLRSG